MDILTDWWVILSLILFWLWIGGKCMAEQLRMVVYRADSDFFDLRYERIVWGMLFGVVFWPLFSMDAGRLSKFGK